MITLDLVLAGLGIGAVAALAGLGLLVTYRLTGVFNLAFGAIAMMAAYVLWQEVRGWHWPVGLAAVVDLGVVCPALGLALERLVFRPLQRRSAAPAEQLVASLGVLVLLLGVAVVTWGLQARLDVPSLVPGGALHLPHGASLAWSTLVDLAAMVALSAIVALTRYTAVGRQARAVVETRQLAELVGIDADRMSAAGWVIGSVLAGLAGVLLAPTLRLEPYGLTLVVLETMVVVVVARLSRAIWAVATALGVGIAQAQLTRIHLGGRARTMLAAITANLFVVTLLGAVLLVRRLDDATSTDAGTTLRFARRGHLPTARGWWVPAAVLLAAPLLLDPTDLRTALQVPALAIVLVSIVALSGYSGQISLGQAGYAGLGALLAARLAAGRVPLLPSVPGVLVLVLAPLLVVPVGLLTGWPAIRRRGLFLALTTFAVGATASRFVFEQPTFVTGVGIRPPDAFGADGTFYVLELVGLAASLWLVRNLHHGRVGRALIALRDDEAGARASGIDVRRLKLVIFSTSAGLAALGGALLAMGARAFDAGAFDPIRSLVWFAAVVVLGIDSALGAVLGAGLLVGLDAAFPEGASTIAIGLGALVIGRLPGGLLHSGHAVLHRLWERARRADAPPPVQLTPAGRLLARRLHHGPDAVRR